MFFDHNGFCNWRMFKVYVGLVNWIVSFEVARRCSAVVAKGKTCSESNYLTLKETQCI